MRVGSFLAVGSSLLVSVLLVAAASASPYKVKRLQAIGRAGRQGRPSLMVL
jgi:hypothetical protein